MIAYRVDVRKDAKRILRELKGHPKLYQRALSAALNKAATRARSRFVKKLAKEVGLKQKDVRAFTTIRKGRPGELEALVEFNGRALNLIRFNAKQFKKGVRAKPWGKSRMHKGTFIANKGRTVFTRHGEAPRLPIYPVFGPSVPREAAKDHVVTEVDAVMREDLPKLLQHEVERFKAKIKR